MTKISSPTQHSTQAYMFIGLQIFITLLVTIWGSLFYGHHIGLSLAGGGLAVILPMIYFALKIFNKIQCKNSKIHLYHFYKDQIVKLCFSITLSVLMLKGLHLGLIPFIIGFLATQFSIFLMPILQMFLKIKRLNYE